MNDYRIKVALKTLLLIETKNWRKLKFENIIENKKDEIFKNKKDLLININRYFDYLLKSNASNIEQSSEKDMLFEIIMVRLDILNIHRKAIKNLVKYFISHPQNFIFLIPSFFESIILFASISNINIEGVKGAAKIKGIFIIYFLSIMTWYYDESSSLEKTMTTLDKYLNQYENITRFLK